MTRFTDYTQNMIIHYIEIDILFKKHKNLFVIYSHSVYNGIRCSMKRVFCCAKIGTVSGGTNEIYRDC